MANLKDIRIRISSVSSTRQITSAMKMVAAAKLRKAQDAILQLRPYADKLLEILSEIGDSLREDKDNMYVAEREIKKVLIVVITSNKGLCGNFNSTVIKAVTSLANGKYREQKMKNAFDLVTLGKKGEDYFKKHKFSILKSENEMIDKVSYEDVTQLASELCNYFLSGEYDRIDIVYNIFKNAAVHELTVEQYLPLKLEESEEDHFHSTYFDYIFEPSKKDIVDELIPKSLKLQLHKALLDSSASEHGARMTAMHKATDNATELIKDLKLDYNKARQANITNEILEIVSGANALEG